MDLRILLPAVAGLWHPRTEVYFAVLSTVHDGITETGAFGEGSGEIAWGWRGLLQWGAMIMPTVIEN